MLKKYKFKDRTVTEVEDSKIQVARIMEETQEPNEQGQMITHRKLMWETITKQTSLGSLKNPNTKIVDVKIEVPRPPVKPEDILGTLFGGKK